MNMGGGDRKNMIGRPKRSHSIVHFELLRSVLKENRLEGRSAERLVVSSEY